MSAARTNAQRTIDSNFREHGVPANYLQGVAAAVPFTVIISDEDRTLQFSGGSKPFAEGGKFEIRDAEIANPVSGAIVALLDDDGSEISRHKIVGSPITDDPFRMVWICTVRPVTA